MSIALGAHVDQTDPIAEATARKAAHVQFFLGDPQGYKGPEWAYAGGPEGLKADAEAAGIELYVHAPYLDQRRHHQQPDPDPEPQAAAAARRRRRVDRRQGADRARRPRRQSGRRRLPAKGFDNWRKAVEATDLKLPLLIENTAGGDNAMTRYLDRIGRVWEAISAAEGFDNVGFCLDTCHAHAGGNALETIVEDVRKITGRIDLVHCNDSRDEFDSGADRHANLGAGRIDPDLLAAVVRDAGAPVVVRDAGWRRRALRRLRLAAGAAIASGIMPRRNRISVRPISDDDHLAFVALPPVRELPADAGLGAGEERVAARVARLVRRRRAGRRRAGALPPAAQGQALPGLPPRGAAHRLGQRRRSTSGWRR